MSGIPLDWLVSVTSSGVKDAFSISKLPTLLIAQGEFLPSENLLKAYDSLGLKQKIGSGFNANLFADNYFSFTSKKASKADLLNVLIWRKTDSAPALVGARAKDLNVLQTINGKFSLTIGEVKADVELDLSQANSFSDCATKLQEALKVAIADKQEFTLATAQYNTQTGGFIIKGGLSGEGLTISFAAAPSEGNDISETLGLSADEGAYTIAGQKGYATLGDLLEFIQVENGGWYVLSFDTGLTDDETLEFARFIHNSNDRYLGTILSNDKNIIQKETALDSLKGFNGVLVDYAPNNSILGLSSGIISALDFSQNNGNANLAFNDSTLFADVALTTQSELNILEANKANSILKFSQIGQSQVWYGMGNILGTKTNSANIYVANSYLKFQLQFSLANMFNSQAFVGLRGDSNEGMIRSYVENVFSNAVNAGIIVEGAELTNTERNSLLSNFGKNGENAIQQCGKVGYYFEIGAVDLVTQKLTITTAYVANKAVKQIVINNYILGA